MKLRQKNIKASIVSLSMLMLALAQIYISVKWLNFKKVVDI